MTEEQLLEILKNRLSISIQDHRVSYVGDGIKVSLLLDGNEISSDYLITDYD